MNAKNLAKQYQAVSAQANVLDADPYKLIQLLMENAIAKIFMSKGAMERNNIHDKGLNISLAISSIDALKASLDKEKGGEIAENLEKLYVYMIQTLLEANLHNDNKKLDEVIELLMTIKEGWDNIPKELTYK